MTVFTNTWNAAFEAQPPDSQAASQGAQRIRDHKEAVRERLEVDHSMNEDADDGSHKKITLVDPLASKPVQANDETYIYSKDIDSTSELFFEDEAGNEVQLSSKGGSGTLVGAVTAYAGSSAPTGWLLCDGSEVSTTTYAALYAVIGADTFGTDAAGNFFLPDLVGRMPIGAGTGDASDATEHLLADKEGTETHTLLAAESGVPEHTHPITVWAGNQDENHLSTGEIAGVTAATTASSNNGTADANSTANAASAHNNLQPSLTLNYIIKT